eukprot:UN03154
MCIFEFRTENKWPTNSIKFNVQNLTLGCHCLCLDKEKTWRHAVIIGEIIADNKGEKYSVERGDVNEEKELLCHWVSQSNSDLDEWISQTDEHRFKPIDSP